MKANASGFQMAPLEFLLDQYDVYTVQLKSKMWFVAPNAPHKVRGSFKAVLNQTFIAVQCEIRSLPNKEMTH